MAKKEKIMYTGFFVSKETVEEMAKAIRGEGGLEKTIECPHVTTEFKPVEIRRELLGESVVFAVIGYANDGKNEGVLVRPLEGTVEVMAEVAKRETPHITISLSAEGKAVDTANLEFRPLAEPLTVIGTYGCFTTKQRVVTNADNLPAEEA